jgi:hypothetical protein
MSDRPLFQNADEQEAAYAGNQGAGGDADDGVLPAAGAAAIVGGAGAAGAGSAGPGNVSGNVAGSVAPAIGAAALAEESDENRAPRD